MRDLQHSWRPVVGVQAALAILRPGTATDPASRDHIARHVEWLGRTLRDAAQSLVSDSPSPFTES